jgi:hypothetical protein
VITLPGAITAHLNDDPYLAVHLIELQGSVVHRWTDAPVDLVFGGNTFLHAASFDLGDITTSSDGDQTASIEFDEESQLLQTLAFTEGVRDRTITIWEAWVDPADGVTVLAVQVIAGPGTTEGVEFIEQDSPIGTLLMRPSYSGSSGTGPRNKYERDCINGYKDARCKYSGGLTTCDRTYTDCTAHTNTLNFRGNRFALVAPKPITWGGGQFFVN